ncbi:hypothetical protein D9M72_502460 [compost metagenome]
MAQAQVGARQRLALGLGRVDAQLKEIALAQHAGEQAQLADGAAALAFDAAARQAGFGDAAVHQRIAQREDVRGDRFEEIGASLGRDFAVGVEGLPGEGAGLVELRRRGAAERGFEGGAGGGIDAVEGAVGAADGLAADE